MFSVEKELEIEAEIRLVAAEANATKEDTLALVLPSEDERLANTENSSGSFLSTKTAESNSSTKDLTAPADTPAKASTEEASKDSVYSIEDARSVLGNSFEVIEYLGSGGMGSVFKVNDLRNKKTFAAKIMSKQLVNDEESGKRFAKEAKAAMSLTHPHLTAVYEFAIGKNGLPYLLMDLIEGKTLAETLAHENAISSDRAINIFSQLADSLSYVHAKGLIHRDIKPSNIMINTDASGSDFVKLFDFGIAKVLNHQCVDISAEITQAMGLLGSPAYLSPEQCAGNEVSFTTDIHALGCVMYKMLTGTHPFEGKNIVETTFNIITKAPKPISDYSSGKEVPKELEQIIMQCLQKNPLERYQTAAELKMDLLRLEKGRKLSTPVAKKRKASQFIKNTSLLLCAMLITFGASSTLLKLNPIARELSSGFFHSIVQEPAGSDKTELRDWAKIQFSEGHYERGIQLMNEFLIGKQLPSKNFKDPYGVNSLRFNKKMDIDIKREFAGETAENLLFIADSYRKLGNTNAAEYYYRISLALYATANPNFMDTNDDPLSMDGQAQKAMHDYQQLLKDQNRKSSPDRILDELNNQDLAIFPNKVWEGK